MNKAPRWETNRSIQIVFHGKLERPTALPIFEGLRTVAVWDSAGMKVKPWDVSLDRFKWFEGAVQGVANVIRAVKPPHCPVNWDETHSPASLIYELIRKLLRDLLLPRQILQNIDSWTFLSFPQISLFRAGNKRIFHCAWEKCALKTGLVERLKINALLKSQNETAWRFRENAKNCNNLFRDSSKSDF